MVVRRRPAALEDPGDLALTQHNIPAAALRVGDVLYAGEWLRISAIRYHTPVDGKMTIEAGGRELPAIGANAKVSIDNDLTTQ